MLADRAGAPCGAATRRSPPADPVERVVDIAFGRAGAGRRLGQVELFEVSERNLGELRVGDPRPLDEVPGADVLADGRSAEITGADSHGRFQEGVEAGRP